MTHRGQRPVVYLDLGKAASLFIVWWKSSGDDGAKNADAYGNLIMTMEPPN